MSQQTDEKTVYCQQCGTALENPKPGQKAVICPCCGAAYRIHDPNAGWLQRKWELLQFRRSRKKERQLQKPAKTPFSGHKKTILGAAVLIMVIAVLPAAIPFIEENISSNEFQKFHTSDRLPVPDFPIEKLVHDDPDLLSVHFEPVTKSQMMDYLHDCEKMGYKIERIPGGRNPVLFSSDGWSLELSYLESLQRLHLSLEAPKPLEAMEWIDINLPKPSCKYSYTLFNTGTWCVIQVSPMDHDQWSQYVDELMEMGFVYELRRYPSSFSAKTKDGADISMEYLGNQIAEISVTNP